MEKEIITLIAWEPNATMTEDEKLRYKNEISDSLNSRYIQEFIAKGSWFGEFYDEYMLPSYIIMRTISMARMSHRILSYRWVGYQLFADIELVKEKYDKDLLSLKMRYFKGSNTPIQVITFDLVVKDIIEHVDIPIYFLLYLERTAPDKIRLFQDKLIKKMSIEGDCVYCDVKGDYELYEMINKYSLGISDPRAGGAGLYLGLINDIDYSIHNHIMKVCTTKSIYCILPRIADVKLNQDVERFDFHIIQKFDYKIK